MQAHTSTEQDRARIDELSRQLSEKEDALNQALARVSSLQTESASLRAELNATTRRATTAEQQCATATAVCPCVAGCTDWMVQEQKQMSERLAKAEEENAAMHKQVRFLFFSCSLFDCVALNCSENSQLREVSGECEDARSVAERQRQKFGQLQQAFKARARYVRVCYDVFVMCCFC